jgi:hypothetical protein
VLEPYPARRRDLAGHAGFDAGEFLRVQSLTPPVNTSFRHPRPEPSPQTRSVSGDPPTSGSSVPTSNETSFALGLRVRSLTLCVNCVSGVSGEPRSRMGTGSKRALGGVRKQRQLTPAEGASRARRRSTAPERARAAVFGRACKPCAGAKSTVDVPTSPGSRRLRRPRRRLGTARGGHAGQRRDAWWTTPGSWWTTPGCMVDNAGRWSLDQPFDALDRRPETKTCKPARRLASMADTAR